MTESAKARLSAAKVRASSDRLPGWASSAVCAMRFQVAQIAGFQKRPISVWSAVRVEPDAAPSALTSSMAAAVLTLLRAGGAGGRNSAAVRITNGLTGAQWVNCGDPKAGGVSW